VCVALERMTAELQHTTAELQRAQTVIKEQQQELAALRALASSRAESEAHGDAGEGRASKRQRIS